MRGRRDALVVLERGAPTADAEGRATRDPDTERAVAGFVGSPTTRERDVGSQVGVTVEAVAQLPADDPIDRTARLRVDAGPLAGTWNVAAVVRGREVTRVLLTTSEV